MDWRAFELRAVSFRICIYKSATNPKNISGLFGAVLVCDL